MAAYNKFRSAVEYMAEGVFNFGSDTLKFMMTAAANAPVNTNTVKANLTEISAGNGYSAGGATTAQQSSAQTAGVYKLVVTDTVFTASGGAMSAFRYVVAYDDTPSSPADPLISWWDYGSEITLASGETFTVDADDSNGLFTVT